MEWSRSVKYERVFGREVCSYIFTMSESIRSITYYTSFGKCIRNVVGNIAASVYNIHNGLKWTFHQKFDAFTNEIFDQVEQSTSTFNTGALGIRNPKVPLLTDRNHVISEYAEITENKSEAGEEGENTIWFQDWKQIELTVHFCVDWRNTLTPENHFFAVRSYLEMESYAWYGIIFDRFNAHIHTGEHSFHSHFFLVRASVFMCVYSRRQHHMLHLASSRYKKKITREIVSRDWLGH